MVRLKNPFSRNKSVDIWQEPNVLKRRSKDEGYVTPYRPEPLMPSVAPPPVPEPVSDIIRDYGEPKIDLSATYIPTALSYSPPLPVAPPGYVSREPSTSTPPYQPPSVPVASYGPPPTRSAPTTAHFERPPMPMTAPQVAPRRDPQPPAPGDLPLARAPGEKITPEELRDLREMIRQRYQLDVQIWSERFLRERDRDITEAKIKKADALMNKIRRTVITWNDPQYFKHGTGDYEAFQEVARRIYSEGKRDWVAEPPWMDTRRAGGDRRLY